jgi:hypothetical protein
MLVALTPEYAVKHRCSRNNIEAIGRMVPMGFNLLGRHPAFVRFSKLALKE